MSTYCVSHMRFNFNPRFGNIRPFVSINSTNDGAGGTVSAGVVTYTEQPDGTETHQITDMSGNLRSDHAYDLVQARMGNEVTKRLVSDDGADVFKTGTVKQNAQVKADKAIKPTTDPAAACAEVALNAPATA